MKKIILIAGSILLLVLILGIGFWLMLPRLWNFLVVNQELKPADVIIVLSGDMRRADYGITLLQSGYSDKILFTGGSARRMYQRAISSGVAEERIIVEDRSNSTFTNAKYSLPIIQARGYKSALVVTSSYHTRRASIIFHELYRGIDLTIRAVPDGTLADHEHNATEIIVSEYLKLLWHYLFER